MTPTRRLWSSLSWVQRILFCALNTQLQLRALMLHEWRAVSCKRLLDCSFSRCYVNRRKNGRVSPNQRGLCNNLYLPAARHALAASSLG